jgi:hypothetical protein
MGLDGIGRGGLPLAPMRPVEVEAGGGTKTFQIANGTAPAAPGGEVSAPVPIPKTPLERLRAGEINRDGYLDLKVDDAVAHLQGLRPEELDEVKTALRGQLASDPALVHLVSQVEGKDAT